MPLTCSDCPKICCSVIIPSRQALCSISKLVELLFGWSNRLAVRLRFCRVRFESALARWRVLREGLQLPPGHQHPPHPPGLYPRPDPRVLHHR
ncbi:hypothetical protein L596_016708 [Steinernema carpocapsae]|uniref:Uncharacterized protein n=1 Tax=Steinernema carpocapsae TaxID=34508 RepID=A0A4V6A3H2_STECR|nr:hypothetical protein L596_016708 [Steinernema carpocapsae]